MAENYAHEYVNACTCTLKDTDCAPCRMNEEITTLTATLVREGQRRKASP